MNKRKLSIALVLVVAVLGFFLGRMTGVPFLVGSGTRKFPDLPAPPTSGSEAGGDKAVADEAALIIESPSIDAVLGDTFDVSGRAKPIAGATLMLEVRDMSGGTLFRSALDVERQSDSAYVRFARTVRLSLAPPPTAPGTVELYWQPLDTAPSTPLGTGRDSQPSAGTDRVTRRVSFADDTVRVSAFYPRRGQSEEECQAVFPVDRRVSVRDSAYRAAIESLLAGPTEVERSAGFFTSIPSGAELVAVAADGSGTVTAEFDDDLDRGVAGSCRVGTIRAQIEATLLHFPEVKRVIISAGGRIDEALQP